MLLTLHVLCFQPSALAQRDATAEAERSAVLARPVYLYDCVYVALLQPWKS